MRFQQLYSRIFFKLFIPKPDFKKPPPLRLRRRDWITAASHRPSLIGPKEFLFLNQKGDLRSIGWSGSERSKLWRYNQHYFDDFTAENYSKRKKWHYKNLVRFRKLSRNKYINSLGVFQHYISTFN